MWAEQIMFTLFHPALHVAAAQLQEANKATEVGKHG
jgi:hypothetical protein